MEIFSITPNTVKRLRRDLLYPDSTRYLYVRAWNCSTSTRVIALRYRKGVAQFKSLHNGKWSNMEPDWNHFFID